MNISWFLIRFWEKLKKIFLLVPRLAIILLLHLEFIKHVIYWILFKTPLQIHYRYTKMNNLSKSPSLALFFVCKLCWFLLKVVSTIFLLVCFVSLKESTCETRKNIFYFTSKSLFVLEIIKFNFSDIQMSWRHQMPKHEARNKFHWINWEVNTVWW